MQLTAAEKRDNNVGMWGEETGMERGRKKSQMEGKKVSDEEQIK